MKVRSLFCMLTGTLFFSLNAFSEAPQNTSINKATKEIALTIDDLPFVGSTHNKPSRIRRENERLNRIIDTLIEYKIPVTGFVVARSIEKGQWALLEKFHKAGFIIGNHTYSHANLSRTRAEKYIEDIKKADEILTPFFTSEKFFRYPYLSESTGKKKQAVINYLHTNNYLIAPVTIDSKDYRFSQQLFAIRYSQRKYHLKRLSHRYLNFIWRQTLKAEKRAAKLTDKPVKHILLLHANLINSFLLGDIINMYQEKGYRFISLKEALKAPAPTIGHLDVYPKNNEVLS